VLTAATEDDLEIARSLGIEIIDGGYRVGQTPTHWIDVMPMIYNWRVCRLRKDSPMTYDRAWCYYGTGFASFLKAVLGARAWDGADDTAPAGWDKNPLTGQYRRQTLEGQ
jgi:hypothetical protein